MFSYREIYTLCPLLFILILNRTSAQGVVFPTSSGSDTCEDTSGRQGICRPITDCRYALENFENERPAHCKFHGRMPIICCVEVESRDDKPSVMDISTPDNIPECGRKPRSRSVINNELFSNNDQGTFISNGTASDLNEWPWMGLLGEKKDDSIDWFCSGVLINSKWILTAAHCTNARNASWVRLGEYNYKNDSDGAQHVDVAVARFIFHADYNPPQAYHDLALIELDKHISFTDDISPVCLPWGKEGSRNLVGRRLDVTGWGAEYFNGPFVEILMEAKLKGFSNEHCKESYSTLFDYPFMFPEGVNQKILCVGDDTRQGRGTCQGDSGGPSVYRDAKGRYILGGIVSRGYGCGKNDFPGIQVKVAHPENLAWIKKQAFT